MQVPESRTAACLLRTMSRRTPMTVDELSLCPEWRNGSASGSAIGSGDRRRAFVSSLPFSASHPRRRVVPCPRCEQRVPASAHVRGCGCHANPSSRRRARASLTLLGLAATACGLSPTPIAATTGCALGWTRLSRSHSRAVRLAVVSRRCRQPASARVWSSSPRDGARLMMRQVRAGTPAASSAAAPTNSTRALVHGRVVTRSSMKREGFARRMRMSCPAW